MEITISVAFSFSHQQFFILKMVGKIVEWSEASQASSQASFYFHASKLRKKSDMKRSVNEFTFVDLEMYIYMDRWINVEIAKILIIYMNSFYLFDSNTFSSYSLTQLIKSYHLYINTFVCYHIQKERTMKQIFLLHSNYHCQC